MLLQLWQVQVSELFNWSSMLLDLKYWWILWRWGQGWICCVMIFKAEYCEVMQRVLKLRLNGFKQVLVLYKKGAGALWLRMGQLLIRSLCAEIFFHSLSYIQIGRCQSTVDYKVFLRNYYGGIEQIKSWLRQQSIILFTSDGDKPGGEAGESTRKEGGLAHQHLVFTKR